MKLEFLNQFIYRSPINSYLTETISEQTLYLASPLLVSELKKEQTEKIKLSLKKYQQRSSTRCTPFGLFAGCGVGEWSESNTVKKQKSYRYTRLDMNIVCEIASLLISNPKIKKHLKFYTNNSLYKTADKYRYVEYSIINKMRHYQITSIDVNDYITDIIELTDKEASYDELLRCLENYDVSLEEAEDFIDELIQNQIIITDLYPSITGVEFYKVILNVLKKISSIENDNSITELYNLLIEIEKDIVSLDLNFDNEVFLYKDIYKKLSGILTDLTEDNLFQTDLYYTSSAATLDTNIQTQLGNAINFIDKLYNKTESENLNNFKRNFISNYEDQEISLLQALDTASGIGYLKKDNTGINPIVDDIFYNSNKENNYNIKWGLANNLLLKKIIETEKKGLKVCEFSDDDIVSFNNDETSLPPSIPVFFRVVSNSKNIIYFKHAGGNSASSLLGRFAHGNADIKGIIDKITEHETKFHADKIIAEILHLPENRIGNILLRPNIHKYEIPYLAKSRLDKANVIDLKDITISVKNDKIILRHIKLDKEIIPRLTSAHNFSLSTLPVYQFLCEIQTQYYEKTSFSFNWGALAGEFDFLPRAVYKNTILFPAQWKINKDKIVELTALTNPFNKLKINEWKDNLNLPQNFLLADGDNELYVDTNDEQSVKAFVSTIKKRNKVIINECLFEPADSLITDEAGRSYANELIGVLLNQNNATQVKFNNQIGDDTKRSFMPGSNWLYYKIYTNPTFSEEILTNSILPLVSLFKEKKLLEKWFFIKYADPENHIRLRLKLTDKVNLSVVQVEFEKLFSPFIDNKIIGKIQLDTYNRELERYGFENIVDTETLFDIDSMYCLKLLSEIDTDEDGDLVRLKYACVNTLELLKHFDLEKDDLNKLISNTRENYFTEHGGQKSLKLTLDEKYRKYRKPIETLLEHESAEYLNEDDRFIIELVKKKENFQKEIVNAILKRHQSNNLKVDLHSYIKSLIHMNINRLFKAKQRTYEMLIYDFMQRSIKSLEARKIKTRIIVK